MTNLYKLQQRLTKVDPVTLSQVEKLLDDYEDYKMCISSRLNNEFNPFDPHSYDALKSEYEQLRDEYIGYNKTCFESDVIRMNIFIAIVDQMKLTNLQWVD